VAPAPAHVCGGEVVDGGGGARACSPRAAGTSASTPEPLESVAAYPPARRVPAAGGDIFAGCDGCAPMTTSPAPARGRGAAGCDAGGDIFAGCNGRAPAMTSPTPARGRGAAGCEAMTGDSVSRAATREDDSGCRLPTEGAAPTERPPTPGEKDPSSCRS
jgi:hypothetical protein